MLCVYVYAQNKPIIQLDPVMVSDDFLHKKSTTQQITTITDTVIDRSNQRLTSLLQNETTIYFKENGLGMVSSPSFRGTTAQQTAVIWNGININSQLLGQTDFNLIQANSYNQIQIRSGGSSVLDGSSAIGGTIYLTNHLTFDSSVKAQSILEYASFNTTNTTVKVQASTTKQSFQFALNTVDSENNYRFLDSQLRNDGKYANQIFSTNYAYKLNSNNKISFYSQYSINDKNLSRTLFAVSNAKYKDESNRNLLEWENSFGKLTSTTKIAYITEAFQYFENRNKTFHTGNQAQTVLAKYAATYKITSDFQLRGTAEASQTKGSGSSITSNKRNSAVLSALAYHKLNDWFLYELGVRAETTNIYNSPFLYSVGIKVNPFSWYSISAHGSKNYRIPSFNDLYWQNSGNIHLKPEQAYQFEMGHHLYYKKFTANLTTYYNDIHDMIRWLPNQSGFWQPINSVHVTTYGFESSVGFDVHKNKHHLVGKVSYAYTVSKDRETQNQLIYVPFDVINSSLSYSYKKISFDYQWRYTGKVYTLSDQTSFLSDYSISNAGIYYAFDAKNNYTLGFRTQNIFNTVYQNVETRPTPGRNFLIHLNLKF